MNIISLKHRPLASVALAAMVGLLAACVPTSKYQEAQQATKDNLRKIEERNVRINELSDRIDQLEADKNQLAQEKDLLEQDTALAGVRYRTLCNKLRTLENDLNALAAKMGDVPEYRSLMNHLSSMQDELVNSNDRLAETQRTLQTQKEKLSAASRALDESQRQLAQSELNLAQSNAELANKAQQVQDQQMEIADKSRRLQNQQAELDSARANIERQAAQLRELEAQLRNKDQAMAELKNTMAKALMDFTSDELTVEHKDGKVYVKLEEKLLFASGQYEVNNKGVSAIRKIASVLKDLTADVDITVEGHTDNIPLRGSVIQDNWDLSAKRATSVVRILMAGGVAQDRLQAVGRADSQPVASNATEEGRCKNRRTEIVLTPRIDQLFKAL